MRRIMMVALLGLAFLGLVGVTPVGADPDPRGNPSGNFFYYYLTCDQGYGPITIATSNAAAAGQIVDGPGNLVARKVTVWEVAEDGGATVWGPETFVFGRGQKKLHPDNLVTCTGYTDPAVNPEGILVRTYAEYQMIATPRR